MSSLLAVGLASGCSQEAGTVDGSGGGSLVYLVHNEVFRSNLDGTITKSLGKVGYNKYRTGWPRQLADGRVVVLGDEWGEIYPYLLNDDGMFERRGKTNVMTTDSIGAATVGGEPRLVLTVSPFAATHGQLQKIDVDQNTIDQVAYQRTGQLLHPSPYADGVVLAVRTNSAGSNVELVDLSADATARNTLATIDAPWEATQPVRLPDGRVAFLRVSLNDPDELRQGDVYIIEADGSVHRSDYMSIIAITVVGKYLVMEAGGGNGISDIVATDLVMPPFNVTHTPYVSEHLTWSD